MIISRRNSRGLLRSSASVRERSRVVQVSDWVLAVVRFTCVNLSRSEELEVVAERRCRAASDVCAGRGRQEPDTNISPIGYLLAARARHSASDNPKSLGWSPTRRLLSRAGQ